MRDQNVHYQEIEIKTILIMEKTVIEKEVTVQKNIEK